MAFVRTFSRQAEAAPASLRRDRADEERRRQFLRLVSHELRTPLNAIIGFSEIIASELHGPIADPRYRDHAAVVHASGQALMKLVAQVVDIARLEEGTMDLASRLERVDDILHDATRSVSVAARDAGVRVDTELDDDAVVVCGDNRAIVAALVNLLNNAIAASTAGSTVRLSAARHGGHVRLAVSDDGPGVPEADIPRLLRPFEQGDDVLVRRNGGAGLGLAVTRLLCRAMRGSLQLASPPGCGVTAVVRLPCAPSARTAEVTPLAPSERR